MDGDTLCVTTKRLTLLFLVQIKFYNHSFFFSIFFLSFPFWVRCRVTRYVHWIMSFTYWTMRFWCISPVLKCWKKIRNVPCLQLRPINWSKKLFTRNYKSCMDCEKVAPYSQRAFAEYPNGQQQHVQKKLEMEMNGSQLPPWSVHVGSCVRLSHSLTFAPRFISQKW